MRQSWTTKATFSGRAPSARRATTRYGIAADEHGNIYASGSFRGTSDFDPGSGVFNLTSRGQHRHLPEQAYPAAPVPGSHRTRRGRPRRSDTQSFTIDVVNNRPPEIVSEPVTTAFAGSPYTYDVNAIDPDDDPLTFSLRGTGGHDHQPASGVITWPTPQPESRRVFGTSPAVRGPSSRGPRPSNRCRLRRTRDGEHIPASSSEPNRRLPNGTPGSLTTLTLTNLPAHTPSTSTSFSPSWTRGREGGAGWAGLLHHRRGRDAGFLHPFDNWQEVLTRLCGTLGRQLGPRAFLGFGVPGSDGRKDAAYNLGLTRARSHSAHGQHVDYFVAGPRRRLARRATSPGD
jgi:hypothetical protein